MSESLVRLPSEYLLTESAPAWQGWKEFRGALLTAGPLDSTTCELIAISGFATLGYEDSFKIHSRRVLESGVSMAALRHAVLVTLGATTAMFQVARALQWLDELDS